MRDNEPPSNSGDGTPPPWQPPTLAELGKLLPQFRIDELLGQGGMGAVYKAYQPSLDRWVAIKLLSADYSSDAAFVANFIREAQLLAKLNHPRITAIYDRGETSAGHLYFVMEYIEGENLRTLLNEGPLSQDGALMIASQICDALHAAHKEKMVHRDIKPENILIDKEGNVKLVDFGLAAPSREAGAGPSGGIIMGTPDYSAPEVFSDEADYRSDIFALGVMLYEMLTGKVPSGDYHPASEYVNCDPRIDRVIARAVQPDRETRYQNANDFKTLVDHLRTTPSTALVVAQPVAVSRPRAVPMRRPVVMAAKKSSGFPFVIVLVVVLGSIGYFVWKKPTTVALQAAEQSARPGSTQLVVKKDAPVAAPTEGDSVPIVATIAEPGFTDLLDSAHAGKWKHCGWLPISLKDGLVTMEASDAKFFGLLWYTEKRFGDFTLKLEFKRPSNGRGNSGVYVRFDELTNPYNYNGSEIEIRDDDETGAIVALKKTSRTPEKLTEWNTMEITV